ncbi:MAG: hypothetical protein ABSF84_17775 [Acidimicrobiales bacterium]|jgi:hypothetical protein
MYSMQFLLDITWSPDGKHVSGTLRPLIQEDAAPFTGTLEFIARIEELLAGALAGEDRAKGPSDAST